jgi:hypothetical protein
MRTATLFAGPALILRARSRRASGATWASWAGWPGPLKDWLAANHALRTLSWAALALHGPCARGTLHGSALRNAGRSHSRRWRRVYRPRAGLWRNHSSLLHNRLAGYGPARRRRRSTLRACCCPRRCNGRLGLGGWRWSNDCCRRMYGRDNHNCRRSGRLFKWRRRNHYRRDWFDQRRCNHNTSFRCRSSRFGDYNSRLLCCWRSCHRRRCFHGRRRSNGCCASGRRFRLWCGRMLLVLLSLPEQFHYVARFGDLRKVNLRFDLCRGRSFSRR